MISLHYEHTDESRARQIGEQSTLDMRVEHARWSASDQWNRNTLCAFEEILAAHNCECFRHYELTMKYIPLTKILKWNVFLNKL